MAWQLSDSDVAMLRRMAARERRLNPELKPKPVQYPRMLGGNSVGEVKFGKANGDITPDTAAGSVIIWDSSVSPPVVSNPVEQIDTVIFDWLSDAIIEDTKEVAIQKVFGLDEWRILWAECPTPPPVIIGD
jgi:hypothetical protein